MKLISGAGTSRLVQCAQRPCCFHRAFDQTTDLKAALLDVEKSGCVRVLTSGGQPTAELGVEVIQNLLKMGSSVEIMAGGGVSVSNASMILLETGVEALHGSFRGQETESGNIVSLGAADAGGERATSSEIVRKICEIASSI